MHYTGDLLHTIYFDDAINLMWLNSNDYKNNRQEGQQRNQKTICRYDDFYQVSSVAS